MIGILNLYLAALLAVYVLPLIVLVAAMAVEAHTESVTLIND